jgi:GT2 family glycosyltransferase
MGFRQPAVEAVAGMRGAGDSGAVDSGAVDSGAVANTVRLERLPEPAWLRFLFYPYLGVTIAFIVWRVSIVNWHVWFGPVALAADLFGAVMMVTFLGITRSIHLPVHRPADLSARVVDCMVTTHREPVSLIEPTVIAALRVRGIRNVLVLGNYERAEVRALAARLGARYHCRGSSEFAKAGSLNAGLKHTDAEFVLLLDADHIVLPQFLERTLGYFDDPAVAFVQTPQSFYNTESFLYRRARGIAAGWWELKMFFHCTQLAKNRWNASFFCGSSAVLRRAAIDDAGGFATSTLTEDIHTSLRIHAKGWRSLYIPERLAFGLEAQNLKQYYSQRRRWAAGSVTLLFRTKDSPLIRRGLTIGQRLNYLNATLLHTVGIQRLFYLMLPLLTLITLRGPVIISISYYGIAFLVYFALSLAMAYLYGRGAHHILHSESYCMANIPAQVSALTAIVRHERLFSSPPKNMVNAERTMAKTAIWALGLICLSSIAYGIFLMASGNHSALVIMAVVWSGISWIWLGSIIVYLEWFERHPSQGILNIAQRPDNDLTAFERYQRIVTEFAEDIHGAGRYGQPILMQGTELEGELM